MVDIDISALSLGTRISGKTSQNNLLQFKVMKEIMKVFIPLIRIINVLIYSIYFIKEIYHCLRPTS